MIVRAGNPRFQRGLAGLSFVELMVGVVILGILTASAYLLLREVFSQGARQDRKTTAWQTYGRFSEFLRMDMANAIEAVVVDPGKLIIRTVRLGPNLEQTIAQVTFRLESPTCIVREEGASRNSFDFSGAFQKGETISLKFSPRP